MIYLSIDRCEKVSQDFGCSRASFNNPRNAAWQHTNCIMTKTLALFRYRSIDKSSMFHHAFLRQIFTSLTLIFLFSVKDTVLALSLVTSFAFSTPSRCPLNMIRRPLP